MARIVLIDTTGSCGEELPRALKAAGWQVSVSSTPDEAGKAAARADALLLVADSASLARVLSATLALRRPGAAVLLATELDRSGWDRAFSAPESLEADALFNLPVDPRAVVHRLRGILEARAAARPGPKAVGMEAVIERAVANEEAAEAFYRRAAEAVARRETRDALSLLADDEREHRRLLEDFRAGRRALPAAVSAAGALLETFGVPEITPDLSPANAFLVAVRKERLAASLYENWAALYPSGPERDLLLRLAEMERGHEARVGALFANAAFPESW
jgi:rubrerythrin